MRRIKAEEITKAIARLFMEANYYLPEDVLQALKKGQNDETSKAGKEAIDTILKNAEIAAKEQVPLCQDCGAAVVFVEIGQDVNIKDGDLYEAINEGVRQGYTSGYLRKSMVKQPFSARVNTKDNTPAIIHADIVPGNKLKITVMPKGGGSENMTKLSAMPPSKGRQGVIDFVIKSTEEAGSNPCPPVIIGVGIGGTVEKTTFLAKKALLRPIGAHNPDPEVAELEKELLEKVNNTGIGPQGFGGKVTALAVNVETFPAHIASMPVAIAFQCHSARHKEVTL